MAFIGTLSSDKLIYRIADADWARVKNKLNAPEEYLKEDYKYSIKKLYEGANLIQLAAYRGTPMDLFRKLLDLDTKYYNKKFFDNKDVSGSTPLHYAVMDIKKPQPYACKGWEWSLLCTKELIERGADYKQKDYYGRNILDIVWSQNPPENICKQFLNLTNNEIQSSPVIEKKDIKKDDNYCLLM